MRRPLVTLLTAFAVAVPLQPTQAQARAAATAAAAAPCTQATNACVQWLTLAGGPARTMVYATYPLTQRNASVTRALVMVHGNGRNADHYFESTAAAGFLAGALGNTLILTPHFKAGPDTVAANEVLWPASGNTWRTGGVAMAYPALTSFDVVDELVRRMSDKRVFPNLRTIVIAGHSAGGQYVSRYVMTTRVHDTPGVTISYVVANPSSYAWPTATRPLPVGDASPVDPYKAALGTTGDKVRTEYTFGPVDASKAPDFNRWPAGLDSLAGYAKGMDVGQLRRNLATRPITLLLGQLDVLPLASFDQSPSGMAQGPSRRARGEAFFRFITDSLHANAEAMIVPHCGHNDRCIFTTESVLPVIFPR